MAVTFQAIDSMGADEPFMENDRVKAFGSTGRFVRYVGEKHAEIAFDRGTTETISLGRIEHA